MTIVLLTFGWIVERSINSHFVQQDVDELNAVVQSLTQALAGPTDGQTPEALKQQLATVVSDHHNALFRVSDMNGNVIYATPDSDLDSFTRLAPRAGGITTDSVMSWRDKGQTYRGAVVQLMQSSFQGDRPLILAVATSIDFHLRYLESFRRYLIIITALPA